MTARHHDERRLVADSSLQRRPILHPVSAEGQAQEYPLPLWGANGSVECKKPSPTSTPTPSW